MPSGHVVGETNQCENLKKEVTECRDGREPRLDTFAPDSY